MRYGLYKKTHFENFGNRAFCQRTADYRATKIIQFYPIRGILKSL